jgi:hypothetical protein
MTTSKIAVWISLAGWAWLTLYGVYLAILMFDGAPGKSRFVIFLELAPHILGALLTIGAGRALGYLAEIAYEARVKRLDRENAESRAGENPDRWRAG